MQAEFSPPLDASLIAAIVADYVNDNEQKPTSKALRQIRNQLSQLAAQAEQDEHVLSEQFSTVTFDNGNSITDDTSSLNDTSINDTTTAFTTPSSCNGSDASSSSPRSFSSPLGFLQAAFPDLPTSTLRNALGSMGDIDDIDMETVVEAILTKEYIRELEERGLRDSEDVADNELLWRTVERKKTPPTKSGKKQRKSTTTITLGDVRQQANVRSQSTPSSPRPSTSPTDPWVQVSSMAVHLATLLPPHPASFFQSIFHSPKYGSPSTALRATLVSISPAEVPDSQLSILHGLFDIILSGGESGTLPAKQRDAVLSDARLAFRATKYDPETALSLLEVIQRLDSDSLSGEWGLFHSPVPSSPTIPHGSSQPKSLTIKTLPSGPPPIPPPPGRQRSYPLSSMSPNAWQTVPHTRKSTGPNEYSHADFIPSYSGGKKTRTRGTGNGMGKGGKGDVGELSGRKGHTIRATELMKQRNEALREASRAWQRGSNKTRGGEIAQYYAAKVSGVD